MLVSFLYRDNIHRNDNHYNKVPFERIILSNSDNNYIKILGDLFCNLDQVTREGFIQRIDRISLWRLSGWCYPQGLPIEPLMQQWQS